MSPQDRLRAAWAALEHRGAVVHRIALDGLTDREVGVLAWAAERRIRVLAEGDEAGWVWLDVAS